MQRTMQAFSVIIKQDLGDYLSEADEATNHLTFIKWQLAEIITQSSWLVGNHTKSLEVSLLKLGRKFPSIEISDSELKHAAIADRLFLDLGKNCTVVPAENYLGDVALFVGPVFSHRVKLFFKFDQGEAEFETRHLEVILEWLHGDLLPLVRRIFAAVLQE